MVFRWGMGCFVWTRAWYVVVALSARCVLLGLASLEFSWN